MLEMERYILGVAQYPHGKEWTFVCPVCAKTFRYDQPGEPMCTGPSEMRDDHEPTTMLLQKVRTIEKVEKFLPPGMAEERLTGPLYVPDPAEAEYRYIL